MPSSRLLFLYIFCLFAGQAIGAKFEEYEYNTNNAHFIRLIQQQRSKRDVDSTTTLASPLSDEKMPDDVSAEEDEESTHIYYNMTVHSNKTELMEKYYVDVAKLLDKGKVEGHKNHPSLVQSYRKAAGAPIGFNFPFYGHNIMNLTIATGGFCYVGDQTHSWLAATQYISPLMANFDTQDPTASISYATDKDKRMVISWNNVSLRDNREVGLFNFQAHLYVNGDIHFIYKDVPIEIKKISDVNHPCKVGISDAYLFNHKLSNDKLPQSMQLKRVIHEYHRITVPQDKITSNTVVILEALPTCLQFTDCNSCVSSSLKTFNCSWCNPKNVNVTAFCSDQAGLHRRRQDWIEHDCSAVGSSYCPATSGNETTSLLSTTTQETVTAPEIDLQNKIEQDKLDAAAKTSGGGGMAALTMFFLIIICASCWVFYAYRNPHSTSGQLLIRYRPSKWQIPSSHVRYSASVHM